MTPERIAHLYPRLYSQKRWDEWMELFDPHALMVRTEAGVATSCQTLHEAMPEQRSYGAENETFIEEWHNVEIHRHGRIATIRAEYTLTTDGETRQGVDVLTVVDGDDGWRIVSVAYEQIKLIRE